MLCFFPVLYRSVLSAMTRPCGPAPFPALRPLGEGGSETTRTRGLGRPTHMNAWRVRALHMGPIPTVRGMA